MAQLPGGEWLIHQIDGQIVLFRQGRGEEIVQFDPTDGNAAAQAQEVIHNSPLLNDEQKCFAHFWSGYFYAHANI